MTKLSEDKIAQLGRLARIGLKDKDHKRLVGELEPVLSHVQTLQQIDTVNVPVTSQVTDLTDVWREDEVKPELYSRDHLLANAPETKGGYIKVKRVL